MDLYLLRHGRAGTRVLDPQQDGARPLTPAGRDGIRAAARWIAGRGITIDLIAASPLTRAQETAAIVAGHLALEDRVAVWDELRPDANPAAVLDRLSSACTGAAPLGPDGAVLLVGHEPCLSGLIGILIAGSEDVRILLPKGGLAKIRDLVPGPAASGRLAWLVTPGILRAEGSAGALE
jgi:phosphohistidine phosphatase